MDLDKLEAIEKKAVWSGWNKADAVDLVLKLTKEIRRLKQEDEHVKMRLETAERYLKCKSKKQKNLFGSVLSYLTLLKDLWKMAK